MQALMQVLRKASLEQNIRFNCSDISCLAGYHPFQDVTACFEKYLYQVRMEISETRFIKDITNSGENVLFVMCYINRI